MLIRDFIWDKEGPEEEEEELVDPLPDKLKKCVVRLQLHSGKYKGWGIRFISLLQFLHDEVTV